MRIAHARPLSHPASLMFNAQARKISFLYNCRRGHLPDARGVQPAGQPQGAQLPGAQVAPGGVHLILP